MPGPLKTAVTIGLLSGFHEFAIMGPICRQFLSEAGFDVTIRENRGDFKAEAIKPYDVIAC